MTRGLWLTFVAGLLGVTSAALVPCRAAESAAPSESQAAEDAAAAESLEELQRRLEILTEEFERLRRGAGPEGSAEPAAADRGRHGLGPAAAKIYGAERGITLGGYGEWLYQGFDDERDDGSPAGVSDTADFLRLVLYTGYKFDERVLFNSEIEYEHASTEQEGAVSVEFAYLDFLLSPRVNVRTGLVLVPVGLINEIHEPPSFLGARRPDVERSILPSTWSELGAGVFGDLGPFSYRAYLTTGLDASGFSASNGIRGGRQSGSEALAEDLALSARLDYTGLPGLLVGAAGFAGDAGQGQALLGEGIDGRVSLLDVHADWRWRGLELRGLWARVALDDAAAISALNGETIGSRMSGGYLQAGYDVLAATSRNRQQLVPFLRLERLDTQDEVPAALAGTVTGVNEREIRTLGVVYRPLSRVAVKLDYQNQSDEAGSGLDQVNAAVGFAF